MAWADNFDTSYGATTSNLSAGMQTYYDKVFLQQAVSNLYLMQFAEKRDLPQGEGKTIQFFRYNEIAVSTTALTEGINPTATLIAGHNVNRTVREYGRWSQYSDFLSATHIDHRLKGWAGLWGDEAGRAIDLIMSKEVVTLGSHSISADVNAAACGAGMRPGQWAVSENGTTDSTTNILYAETAVNTGDLVFDDTDNWFIGGLLTGTSGANYGQSRYVYDSVSATNAMYVYPYWESAPAAGDTFIFSHPGKSGTAAATAHALDTADTLTHAIFATALEDLQTYRAPTYSGGYYIFLIGPTTNKGFMVDTDGGWMGLAQYRGDSMYKGEIGKYMGFRVVQTSHPFRCVLPTTATTGGPGATSATDYSAVGANYASGGAGHYSLAFGRHAFAATRLAGFKTPKIIVHPPGSAGSADPLNRQGTVGYNIKFTPAALNALWCASVVSGG